MLSFKIYTTAGNAHPTNIENSQCDLLYHCQWTVNAMSLKKYKKKHVIAQVNYKCHHFGSTQLWLKYIPNDFSSLINVRGFIWVSLKTDCKSYLFHNPQHIFVHLLDSYFYHYVYKIPILYLCTKNEFFLQTTRQ